MILPSLSLPGFITPRIKEYGLCFIYGGITALGFAPTYLWFFIFYLPLVGIWKKTRDASPAVAFWQGWWFGFGYFTIGLYWIAFALGVDLDRFAWLIPFAVLGLPAFLAFFIAPAFWIAARWGKNLQEEGRLLLFAISWTLLEMARGTLLTGFPWNLIGYIWMDYGPISQSLSYIGIYGLSFLTILWTMSLGLRQKGLLFLGSQVTLLLCFGLGSLRSQLPSQVPNLTLRVVQPSIPQNLKWSAAHREINFQTLLNLTKTPSLGPAPSIILWPESATSFFLGHESHRRQQIREALPAGSVLITGTPRGMYNAQKELQIWNSLMVWNTASDDKIFYDKSHLVPFGEYIPFRSHMPSFIQKVTPGSLDYSAGSGPKTLATAGVPPFLPVICYEVIFPGAIRSSAGPSPEWILNITNDAWYGRTSGPYQHFAIAQARAIEEGLPLVRVGNNGISGVIDPYGKVLQKLDLNERGVLDISLPRPCPHPTLFSHYGNKIALGMILIALLSLVGFRRRMEE